MNLDLIHPGLIMTNYRTLKSGVDNFYDTASQNVSASVSYKHARHGLFANGMVMQSWTQLPYTLAQQIYGDYVIYSYADAKRQQNAHGYGKPGQDPRLYARKLQYKRIVQPQ